MSNFCQSCGGYETTAVGQFAHTTGCAAIRGGWTVSNTPDVVIPAASPMTESPSVSSESGEVDERARAVKSLASTPLDSDSAQNRPICARGKKSPPPPSPEAEPES